MENIIIDMSSPALIKVIGINASGTITEQTFTRYERKKVVEAISNFIENEDILRLSEKKG